MKFFILLILLAVLLLSGCAFKTCKDGTFYGTCSTKIPYYCTIEGKLVKDENKCGFNEIISDYNYSRTFDINRNYGEPPKKCSDNTRYNECSQNKPYYCEDGNLVKKASICGCPQGLQINGTECVQIVKPEAKTREFEYVLKGESGKVKVLMDLELKEYLGGIPRTYYCTPECPSKTQLELRFLNDDRQKIELDKVVKQIKEKTSNAEDQARIAVSLVQKIPYDMTSLLTQSDYERYPYEVFYDNNGVCGEKSKLLAYFLRSLGFGTALLTFEKENHQSIGIKCPSQYGFKNTGYCFIESTTFSIITESDGNYLGAGRLESTPEVLIMSDGNSFDSVSEEYEDNLQYQKFLKGLDQNNYKEWRALRNKYGFQATSCDANQNYCDGYCWLLCGEHYVFNCGGFGGICKPNPLDCPQGMSVCADDCWPACEQGNFKCTPSGAVCEITIQG